MSEKLSNYIIKYNTDKLHICLVMLNYYYRKQTFKMYEIYLNFILFQ